MAGLPCLVENLAPYLRWTFLFRGDLTVESFPETSSTSSSLSPNHFYIHTYYYFFSVVIMVLFIRNSPQYLRKTTPTIHRGRNIRFFLLAYNLIVVVFFTKAFQNLLKINQIKSSKKSNYQNSAEYL